MYAAGKGFTLLGQRFLSLAVRILRGHSQLFVINI
jgi:hypothetical protein